MFENCVIDLPKKNLVCCRFWVDECVVYNQLTGETHLIDGIGAVLLKAVSEKSSTRSELLHNVQNIFDIQGDFDIEGFLDSSILEYQKLGLVEVTEKHS